MAWDGNLKHGALLQCGGAHSRAVPATEVEKLTGCQPPPLPPHPHPTRHRVFRGVIETPLGQDSYAIVSVDAKQIEVQGFGGVESAVWELG